MSLLSYVAAYAAGAGSTVAGAWAASKIRVYHNARNSHRDELKSEILRPVQDALMSAYGEPKFSVEWAAQLSNPDATARESPHTLGMVLKVTDPGPAVYRGLSEALLEDVRAHHFKPLMSSWEAYRDSWTAHVSARHQWVEEIGKRVLVESGIRVRVYSTNPPYVEHLKLALFVYSRLMEHSARALEIRESAHAYSLGPLYEKANFAVVEKREEIQKLSDLIDTLLISQKEQASVFHAQAKRLQSHRESLIRQFSLALASKRLPHLCPLVTFR